MSFKPVFKKAVGYDSDGNRYLMNDYYYADEATAQWISGRWGTGKTREVSLLGPGPFSVDTKMFEAELKDGTWVNAGILAAFYDRNNEDLFPGVAEALVSSQLGFTPFPMLPTVLPPHSGEPVKPLPPNTKVEPRTQFGTYPAPGDMNPAGKIIDNPFEADPVRLLIKVIDLFMGERHYWIDAPAGSVLN